MSAPVLPVDVTGFAHPSFCDPARCRVVDLDRTPLLSHQASTDALPAAGTAST